ncbi:MAG: cofactor-independent phosphoglycerate mutase [Candidatus Aureabacteria bacterium]|nr:cofactor-independent phosphoglycerate mutase [Candidatus Auribacterota bacterium]
MKYIVVVGDGMADYGLPELEGKTPLCVARKPNIDLIAENGVCGYLKTVPARLEPGSDIANMSILGYNPLKYYSGRGPFEALSRGIELRKGEIAFRCNLVTVDEGLMVDYSAGHIKTEEARSVIKRLNEKMSSEGVRFYPGVSYRHIMIISEETLGSDAAKLKCIPPHDISGKPILPNLPSGKGSKVLTKLMQKSAEILHDTDINSVRLDLRENPANMIWLWGAGKLPEIPSFKKKFGLDAAIISAVDLLKGIGKALGMDVIDVPGATGYYDTDYAAKAEYALNALSGNDLVFIHIEAPDEAGHNGDLREKIKAIENIDEKIVKRIMGYFSGNSDYRILFLCDHATPVSLKTHTRDPVPFCMSGRGIKKDGFASYDEQCCKSPTLKFEAGYRLMDYFIKH